MRSEPLPGKEEYLNSEKFQIAHYDWKAENWLMKLIAGINKARKDHEALQQTNNIRFCHVENDKLIAFYKWNDARTSEVLVIISLDDHYSQRGTVQLPVHELGIGHDHKIVMRDLIPDVSYDWNGEWNFVELHPNMPLHIFEINK
jgi:starch synthase (maltosyl-transferring)